MNERELSEDHWLLAYEANIQGWLPNPGGKDFVAAHKEFGAIKAFGVSFYDAAAIPAIAVKPETSQQAYPDSEDDSEDDVDDELQNLLGISG